MKVIKKILEEKPSVIQVTVFHGNGYAGIIVNGENIGVYSAQNLNFIQFEILQEYSFANYISTNYEIAVRKQTNMMGKPDAQDYKVFREEYTYLLK